MKHKFPMSRFKDVQMLIHAIACAIAYGYMFEKNGYHFYGAAFLTWEASTPFLYIHNILRDINMKNTIMYRVNGLMFCITFFFFRIIFGSYVFWWLVWNKIGTPLKVVGVTLNGLNYMWMYMITKKFSQ